MVDWRHSPLLVASVAVHVVAIAAMIAVPHRWPVALAVLIANHVAILAACLTPRSLLLGPNMRRVAGAPDAIALTFDDGPDPRITPEVLEVLDRAGAKATFFCIGEKAAAHPEIVASIRARGHGVQNHSQTHPGLFVLQGPHGLRRQIADATSVLERCTGERPIFFRAPAGHMNPFLFPVLQDEGLSLVSWTRRGFDTASRDPKRITRRLTRDLRAGDILLLHDRVPVVLEVLPRVLEAIQDAGLRAESLETLTASRRTH